MTTEKKEQIIVSFVPVLHTGYINFFKKYPNVLYILDSDFVADIPKLERDIRQTESVVMKKAIESLGIFKEVKVLSRSEIGTFTESVSKLDVIMPDDNLAHELKEKFFSDVEVEFVSIFLRWDKNISQTEFEVSPDRIISTDEVDKILIQDAENEAKKSSDWWRQVGAVIVREGKVLLQGHNRHLPTDLSMDAYGDPRSNFDAGERFDLSTAIHGEAGLIARAAREGVVLKDSHIYVTTYPCPNCAKLIAESGIKKVFYLKGYSLLDAENILKSYGVEIILVK